MLTKPLSLLAITALAVSPALAQDHGEHDRDRGNRGGEGMGEHGEMMGAMARVRAFNPQMLIEHRESLELTDHQVTQLEAIGSEADSIIEQARESHMAHHELMATALSRDTISADEVLGHMAAAHAVMGLMHRTQVAAAIRSRAILTEEQRDMVAEMAHSRMEEEHGERRMGNRS